MPTPLPEEEGIDDTPEAFVIFPPNGPGDNGYLDKVLSAVSRFSIEYPGKVRMMQTTEANTDSFGGSLLLPSIDFWAHAQNNNGACRLLWQMCQQTVSCGQTAKLYALRF